MKLCCWESVVPSVLKCCSALIFSAIYPSPSHFCWLATHSCRPLPALTLPGQHTVFLYKSSFFTAFLWRWRHVDLQNVWDYLPTNTASHHRNWNLKFQLLETVTHLINVLTLWCVCWCVPVMHCDAWNAGGQLWPLLCSPNLNCILLYLITLSEG